MADRKPRRSRQRRGFVDVINALLTLAVVGLLVVGGLFLYGAHTYYAAGPITADTNFVVEHGNNLGTVAERLEKEGLIDNRYFFEIGGWATKKQGALKAGEFKLTANASMADVLKELTEGKPVQHGLTIPEGFTVAQVVDRLNSNDQLSGTLTSIPPEGGILPETYNFEPGATRQSVLDQMVSAQQKAVADVWANHDPSIPVTTPDQLVILASIVEKETGVPAERAHVAAVFANRLKKGMRLQSDPTIIYGITKGEAPLGRPLKRSEVEAATPYNTYQVDGLPPTPIDNPGLEALKAVANPDKSNDIYFVAATTNPADGHLFAASYAEHKRNVAKLRLAQRQQAIVDAEADADAAKDQLEAQQAAADGDATASTDTSAAPPPMQAVVTAPDAEAPPTASASDAPPPVAPGTPTSDAASPSDQTAGAPASPDSVPFPMPADLRPTDAAPAPSAPTDATPSAAPTTPETPSSTPPATRPPTRPTRPRPATTDAFGG